MKVSINMLIHRKLSAKEKVYLPKIGVVYYENNHLKFTLNAYEKYSYSIIDDISNEFKINIDIANKRYEYWRNAVTIDKDQYSIIRIEHVVWIISDADGNYYYTPDTSDCINHSSSTYK